MKRNEIDANQIHEICEMADKSLNSLMPALLSSHYSSPHSPHCLHCCSLPISTLHTVCLSSPTPSQTVAIQYNHLTCNKKKRKKKKKRREREREREGVPCFQLAFIRVIA
jgi:hypothetical protein